MADKPARPAYRVETERLVIRCWSPEDGPRLRRALDELDGYLRPWIPWMQHEPLPLEQTVARLRAYRANFDSDRDYRYAVLDRGETELIGENGLYTRVGPAAREIGYWIHARHAGQGYAVEASAAMVKVAFEIDRVQRIEIHCAPENVASTRVPIRLGFKHEATLPKRIVDTAGGVHGLMVWTLFADDYPDTLAAELPIRAYDCIGERIL